MFGMVKKVWLVSSIVLGLFVVLLVKIIVSGFLFFWFVFLVRLVVFKECLDFCVIVVMLIVIIGIECSVLGMVEDVILFFGVMRVVVGLVI